MHVLRDCPRCREVWSVLYPKGRVPAFFELQTKEWFLESLKCQKDEGGGLILVEKMVSMCGALWHWQNRHNFRDERTPPW